MLVKSSTMIKLFFSYSHRDEDLRDELETHLSSLKRLGVIDAWHDHRIPAGKDFVSEISHHLEDSQIILLLVSPYFIASDYCYDVEMTRALELHVSGKARILPVILHPCDWQDFPFGKLQALPKDGKPISKYPNLHDAFLEITLAIRAVAKEFENPLNQNLNLLKHTQDTLMSPLLFGRVISASKRHSHNARRISLRGKATNT